jgi:hypothetical protein
VRVVALDTRTPYTLDLAGADGGLPLTRRGGRSIFDRLPSAQPLRRVKGKNAHYLLRWVNPTGEKGPPALDGPLRAKPAVAERRVWAACQGWSETATATIGAQRKQSEGVPSPVWTCARWVRADSPQSPRSPGVKLKTLRIRNFRCFESIDDVDIGSMHALVGANNAGKSTVLRALDFLFNPSTKKINEESFYLKNASARIEVEGVFVDLNTAEQEALRTCLKPDGTFHLMRTAQIAAEGEEGSGGDDEGESKVKILAHYCKPQPKIDWLNPAKINGDSITTWWAAKTQLVHNGQSFADTLGTRKPSKADWITKAAEFATTHLKANDLEDAWNPNPQGYANVLKATLPHYELIPAVRDATDEAKVTKTSPFGRLIYEIMRTLDTSFRSEVETALKATTLRLNREGKENRAPKVAEIESTIRGFLREVMPADLELEFQAPTIEVLLTTPKIYVDDGFTNSDT